MQPPICKCGTTMRESREFLNTLISFPDFPGDTGSEAGSTISRMGPARLVSSWKCPSCGRAFTK
jgi:hypothetical protein